MLYTRMIRPVLYRMGRGDPEVAHSRTLEWLTKVADTPWLVNALTKMNAVADPVRVFGIDFPNTVGLAAGMDKNGVAIDAWPALGFGFVEIGTVTWQSQPGNPRPRLYRLPESRALINRMGFNNDGASALAKRLGTRARPAVPIGISIGKSKVTPIEQAVDDYVASFGTLYGYGDYFAINVSSPNTPGLRNLQDGEQLTDILTALQEENARQARGGPEKPILVKIAPDLTENAIAQAIEVCLEHQVAGIIATNTTLARDGVADSDHGRAAQSGGLSGGPLRDVTRSIVSFIHRETNGELPIIGVGGITSGDHAGALIDAGASLVQLYTGLVYDGPSLVRKAAKSARKQAETAHSSYSRGPSRSSRVGSADSALRAHHQPPVPGYSNSPVNPYPTSGPANPYPTSGAASGHSVSGPGYLHSGPTSGPGYGDNPYPASGGGYRHQEPRSGSVSGGGYQGAAPVSGSSSPYSPGYGDNPYPASGGGYQGAAHVSGAANPYGPGYPDTTGARQDEPPTGSANPYPQDRRYSTQPHSDDIDPRTGRPYRDWGTN